jgi:hypothetical protein
MLVSPLLAAAALTQTVGTAMDYGYTALLFIEPLTATLATVDTADGSIVDLHRQQLQCARQSPEVAAELATMVGALDGLESRPDGVFIVGCGVDIVPIKRHLDALISVPLSAPEEPDIALARGAALASATAPLFTSSTAALAYALDPGTGQVKPHTLAPAYLDAAANAQVGDGAVAYSALADDDSDGVGVSRPFLLTGTGLGAIFLIGLVTLLISLSADLGPRLGQRHLPHAGVMPTKHMTPPSKADAPAAAGHRPVAPPAAAPQPAPAPAPPPQTFTVPTPVVQQLPQRVATPAPVHRAPSRPAPAEVPAPAAEQAPPPAAPPPPPAAPPPAAPAPQLPPMVMYLHLPFVTIPIPINPPPPAPGP